MIPRGEYRAGLFIHHAPDYSFKVPDGWRRARPEDAENIAFNRRLLQRFNDQGRSAFIGAFQNDLRRYDAILISTRGAYLQVESGANTAGAHFASGYVFNDRERDALW